MLGAARHATLLGLNVMAKGELGSLEKRQHDDVVLILHHPPENATIATVYQATALRQAELHMV